MTAPIHKPITDVNLNRFKAYYAKWFGWGNIQNVLGYRNVKDKDVGTCKATALMNNDEEGAALCDLLMPMSKSQRLKLSRQVLSC